MRGASWRKPKSVFLIKSEGPNAWNVQQLAAKIDLIAKSERKRTSIIEHPHHAHSFSPLHWAPLLSFSIQDPWALCQLGILRTHSKETPQKKSACLKPGPILLVFFFFLSLYFCLLTFPTWGGIFWLSFSPTLPLRREGRLEGGGLELQFM